MHVQEQALGVPAQHSTHEHLLGNAYTNQHLQDTDSGHAAREVAPLQTVFPGSEGGAAVRDDDASPRGDAESVQTHSSAQPVDPVSPDALPVPQGRVH